MSSDSHPVSDRERQLKQQILDLYEVVHQATEPWMSKRWSKTLERLSKAEGTLMMMNSRIANPKCQSAMRLLTTGLYVYNMSLGSKGKNQFIPGKSESVWEQLSKALPADKRPLAVQLRVALEEHVKPIAHLFAQKNKDNCN
jgi:hypothetical protein